MKDTKGHGSLPPAVVVPKIIVTDYDAELASQQSIPINNHVCRSSTRNESGEEANSEIIDSLKNTHLVKANINADVDVNNVITAKNENPSMVKVQVDNSEKDVEVDAATTSTPMTAIKTELTEVNVKLLTELRKLETKEKLQEQSESATDDDAADQEVSNITSLIESNYNFAPLPLPNTIDLDMSTAKIVPKMIPSSKLPNTSDPNVPQRVPVKKHSNPLFDSPESRRVPDSNTIQFNGDAASGVEDSRFKRSDCIPSNGEKQPRKRRTRQYGESGSSSSICSSPDKVSESSDDLPPIVWKLRDSSSESRHDDNVPPSPSNNGHTVSPTTPNNGDSVPTTASINDDSVRPIASNNDDSVPLTASNNGDSVPRTSTNNGDSVPTTPLINDDSVRPIASNNDDSVPLTVSNNVTKSSSSQNKSVESVGNDEKKK